MNYINNITEAIGHTPLLKLNRVGKDAGANVFVKLEHLNPSCRARRHLERQEARRGRHGR